MDVEGEEDAGLAAKMLPKALACGPTLRHPLMAVKIA